MNHSSHTTVRKTRVYIAGPYSHGDPCVNTYTAVQAANVLLDHGYAPFVPHLNHLWHTISPRPYKDWMDLDNQFLLCCDAVLRLPGESHGADQEVESAGLNGLPVYHSMEALMQGMPTSQQCHHYSPHCRDQTFL